MNWWWVVVYRSRSCVASPVASLIWCRMARAIGTYTGRPSVDLSTVAAFQHHSGTMLRTMSEVVAELFSHMDRNAVIAMNPAMTLESQRHAKKGQEGEGGPHLQGSRGASRPDRE